MPFFLVMAVGCIAQSKGAKPIVGRALPATTKPVHLISAVLGKPLLNVSEYFMQDIKKRQRVFRYSWKGDLKAFIAKLNSQHVGKNGWALRQFKEDGSWELKRALKTGPVIMESYLIKSVKLSLDPKGVGGLKAERTKPGPNGWIWVSYNERYAK